MSGGSYLGITQRFAAAQGPPSLKAIFPAMHLFDIYDQFLTNGIFMRDFLEQWDASVRNMDNSTPGQTQIRLRRRSWIHRPR